MIKEKLKIYANPKKYFYMLTRRIKKFAFILRGNMEDGGERVQLFFKHKFFFDPNEKCHLARYNFGLNLIGEDSVVGDFACGTGYGTVMFASKAKRVIGADIAEPVVRKIRDTYKDHQNVEFLSCNIVDLKFQNTFDYIFSFETLEHLDEGDILKALARFKEALKPDGVLVFSTPFMQEKSKRAMEMGFHRTFCIDENKIKSWLEKTGFCLNYFKYQNYEMATVADRVPDKSVVITVASKR